MNTINSVTNDQRPRLQVKLERLADLIEQIQLEYLEIERATNRLDFCQTMNPDEMKDIPEPADGFLGHFDNQINKLQRLKNAMSETRERLLQII